ncbi:MAG: hypothetical protein GKS03_13375 [Alphaproteobacteria bacterium]|nr:hypothetical protein [Alphaproteobacteria bacterium]
MTTSAKQQRSRISNVLRLVVTDIHFTNASETMSRLIWKLYNNNLISIEVANQLLDEHYMNSGLMTPRVAVSSMDQRSSRNQLAIIIPR